MHPCADGSSVIYENAPLHQGVITRVLESAVLIANGKAFVHRFKASGTRMEGGGGVLHKGTLIKAYIIRIKCDQVSF